MPPDSNRCTVKPGPTKSSTYSSARCSSAGRAAVDGMASSPRAASRNQSRSKSSIRPAYGNTASMRCGPGSASARRICAANSAAVVARRPRALPWPADEGGEIQRGAGPGPAGYRAVVARCTRADPGPAPWSRWRRDRLLKITVVTSSPSRAWVVSAEIVYIALPSDSSAMTGRSGHAMAAPAASGSPWPMAPPVSVSRSSAAGPRPSRTQPQARRVRLVADDGALRQQRADDGGGGYGGERAVRNPTGRPGAGGTEAPRGPPQPGPRERPACPAHPHQGRPACAPRSPPGTSELGCPG